MEESALRPPADKVETFYKSKGVNLACGYQILPDVGSVSCSQRHRGTVRDAVSFKAVAYLNE